MLKTEENIPHSIFHKRGQPAHDREWYADDLLRWAEDKDNWIIKDWRIKYGFTRSMVMEMCNTSKEFLYAYEHVHDVIASRREKMNHADKMKDSLFNLYARTYDRDLDAQKKDEKKFESEVKNIAEGKGQASVTVNLIDYAKNKD